ncbi:dipeptidase [Ferrimonas balearica]|uniref:dipeptidase n=1 Tax=Ferrimonas balearica TaxID=44012 RepID=UPI001C99C454|nr:membrane dipeptidase [Ferrimonas balearica]MBY5993989.1 dipeptidase [Ferrimonas balearica]
MTTDRRTFIKQVGLGAGALALGLPAHASLSPLWPDYDRGMVIDGLCLPFDAGQTNLSPAQLAAFKASGITAVNATIPYPGDDFDATVAKIANTQALIRRHPDHLRLVTRTEDLRLAKAQGQLGIIIGFQSVEMFADHEDAMATFAGLGARIMQPSYNGPSPIGTGGLASASNGLSEAGRQWLAAAQQHGVLVDLSHGNRQTVRDALDQAQAPLALTHTGCNAIYRHPRNNDDAELKRVAEGGGVVGIYQMPFLDGGQGELTKEMFLAHLKHALNLCGEDAVSVGSDQGIEPIDDGPEYRQALKAEVLARRAAGISAPGESPDRPPFIPHYNNPRRMELVAADLAELGYPSRVIDKVIGANLARVFAETWT